MGDAADGPVLGPQVARVPAEVRRTPLLTAALGEDLLDRTLSALGDQAHLRRRARLPVLLADAARPWEAGNAWARHRLRDAPEGTRNGYAHEVLSFASWCWTSGIDPLEATEDDILDYRDVLTEVNRNSPSTWNHHLAAIASAYEHWLAMGLVHSSPWRDRKRVKLVEGDRPVRAVPLDAYRQFRDYGLRGLRPDGLPDPDFPGRTGERNAAFADLLVVTGMRRVEATHLLLPELPPLDPARKVLDLPLPDVICKRGRGRTAEIPASYLRRYRQFLETEWPGIVAAAQRALRHRSDLLVADELDVNRIRIGGRSVELNKLGRQERLRLVATAELARALGLPAANEWLVPLGLFPSTRGVVIGEVAWTSEFRAGRLRAAKNLAGHGQPPLPRITPHVLRHTYGVEYMRQALEMANADGRDAAASQGHARIRRHFLNPLTELRERMGHRDMETTIGYLRAARRTDALADLPYTSWTDALFTKDV